MQEIRWYELADGSRSCKYPRPFHGAEGIPRPLAHLCHIPFLAPQPSPRRALPVCQCRLHRWRSARQPWVSAVRQTRAWQGGGGATRCCSLVRLQREAAERRQSQRGVSLSILCWASVFAATSQSVLKSQRDLLALPGRVLSDLKENSEHRPGLALQD